MRHATVVMFVLLSMFSTMVCAQSAREYFKFAKFRFDNHEYKSALDFINKAISEDSVYQNAYYLRARIYFEQTQYYSAIVDINRLLNHKGPADFFTGDIFLLRARCHLALNEFALAAEDFERAEPLLKGNPILLYYQAKLDQATGNYPGALAYLDQAQHINPKMPDVYAFRAEIKNQLLDPKHNQADYQSILNDINQAIALEPKEYKYLLIRSKFYNEMGKHDEAVRDFDNMIALFPNNVDAYSARGVAEMNQYNYRSAALDFTKSILIDPNNEKYYRLRGLCYNNLENYPEALKDYTTSIDLLTKKLEGQKDRELQNTLAETYILRGHCLNLMGNNARACRDFLMAHNLGIKKGLNYYRKYCGLY